MSWRCRKITLTGSSIPDLFWKELKYLYVQPTKKNFSNWANEYNMRNYYINNCKSQFSHRTISNSYYILIKHKYLLSKRKLLQRYLKENCLRYLCTSASFQANSQTLSQTAADNKDLSLTMQPFSCERGVDIVQLNSHVENISAITTPTLEPSVLIAASKKMLYLPDFPFIQAGEASIFYTHLSTGLPWWSAIVLTAFVTRKVLIVPLNVYQQHNIAKVEAQGPELKALAKKIQMEVSESRARFYWTEQKTRKEYHKKMKQKIAELRIRDNCHPMKNVAALYLQIPIFLSISFALRNISVRAINPMTDHHSDYVGLTEQGTAWFTDLTATDSTWILPIMLGAVTLFNIEVNYLNSPKVTNYRKYLTYFLRSVSLIMVPICATVPSAMAVYWVSSGLFAASTNILLNYSRFRRLVNLPKSSYESNRPIRDLALKAKQRYFKT